MDDKNVYAIADGVVESVNAHGTAYGISGTLTAW